MESKFLNPYDKEYMKMAMLKHEETFRDQVNELHRLYRIQKILMKEIAKNRPRPWKCMELENRALEFSFSGPAGEKCRVSEVEDDQNDLELTLGPKSYNQKKIKAAEQTVDPSDLGPSFSSSSPGSNGRVKRTRNSTREELLSQQKWAGLEMSNLSNQERLDTPHWYFKVLSLNMA